MTLENLFADVRFNCIGEVDEKIKDELKKYKAKEEKLLSGSATHAIVTDFDNMEAEEARDLWQIPTVTPSWVTLSIKCQQLLPTKAFYPSNNRLFSGLVICASQLSRSDCCRLWALINFHGGEMQLNLTSKCTHLVVSTPTGKKYEMAQTKSSVTCVTLDWILNSVKDSKLKDASKYHPSLVIVPPKPSAVSSSLPFAVEKKNNLSKLTSKPPFSHEMSTHSSAEVENNDIPTLNPLNIQQSMISATQLSHQHHLSTNVMSKELPMNKDSDSISSSAESSSLLANIDMKASKQAPKKTQSKKRRSSKQKTTPPQSQATKPVANLAIMSPMKSVPSQIMGTPSQANYIPQGQQPFNMPQQNISGVANPMKMMNLSNTCVPMGFSPNYSMTMDTMATGMHDRPRGYTHPQMIQMNQQQLQQQMQLQQLHRGANNSMNQFANPQQQMMNQQLMTQQHLQQQQLSMNPRQPGQMFVHQQMTKGNGMMFPQQPNPPAVVSSPQQFMTQPQQTINKPPSHTIMMQRMMSANRMPHQPNSQHQMQRGPSSLQQSPLAIGGGMEAISPKALQQGLLIAQQNQRQQQQPLIHPSLQTPQEMPGSPGGAKKRSKPRKTKDCGESKPRARGKSNKKTNVTQPTPLPLQVQKENVMHSPSFSSPYNPPIQPHHIVKSIPQSINTCEMLHGSPHHTMLNEAKHVAMEMMDHAPVQISASIVEKPLPPLREPFENPLTAVPESYEGKYHGHDPSENVPKDLCLLGCVFVLVEYEKFVDAELQQHWEKEIKKYGGIVETDYNSATCTHLLCASQTVPLFRQALLDGKRCVSLFWLNDILLVRDLRPPWLLMHIPTPFDQKNLPLPLTDKMVTYTGFHQKERECLKRMLSVTGAKVTNNLTKQHSLLVCKHLVSLKSDKAHEWGIPCVNVNWLKAVIEGDKPDINEDKYKQFSKSPTKLFTLSDENMKQILDPWKVPVRITLDCMQRAHVKRKSITMPNLMPPMKRAKIEETYQPLPRVCFTALTSNQVADLTVKLESLGGKVCNDVYYATHLVTKTIIRTKKFFSAVALGLYVVTIDWINESAKSKWLLDELKYMLRDKIGEEKFNFSLEESLKRARQRLLFQDYLFYITENVRPSKVMIEEIVTYAGGKIMTTLPPVIDLKRIQRRLEMNNKILLISCQGDSEQVAQWKREGIVCHSSEMIFNGILKQAIDEISFKL